jgi:hypothetical protein
MPKKDSPTNNSLAENLRKNYPNDLKLEGGFNAQLDKAIEKEPIAIKQIKKELGITNKDIADMFGYKNEASYRNAKEGKKRLERGIEALYSLIKSK